MKRAIACVLMYAMVISVAAGGNRSAASVKGKLNKKKVTIAIGKNVQLKVKEKGSARVYWSSSKKKVARVSSSGKVRGYKKGKTVVTAKVKRKGRTKRLKCKVTVVKGAKSVLLTNKNGKRVKSLTLNKYDSVRLFAKMTPRSSNDKATWKSSNNDVVTVKNGVVTGQYVGKATIRATTYSGKKVKVKVAVKAPTLKNTLKDTYKADFKIGVAANTWQMEGAGAYAKAKELISEQFNSITMENQMKPHVLLSSDNVEKGKDTDVLINEANLEQVLRLASDNGLKLRGHTLIWHNQTPEWFFHKGYDVNQEYVTKDVMRLRMESYIKKVLTYCQTHYPGLVYAWDVANEVVTDEGDYRTKSNWYRVYGDESYITDAFTFARRYADKDVKLFLNDYNEYNTDKRDKLYHVLKNLYEAGICDGMGMQSHYLLDYPTLATVKVAIQKYNQIDPGKIEIQLTELDIHTPNTAVATQKKLADKYEMLFRMLTDCKRNQKINITGVTFWGLTDADTWLTDFKGEASYPALFGGDYAAKPSYFAVLNAMKPE